MDNNEPGSLALQGCNKYLPPLINGVSHLILPLTTLPVRIRNPKMMRERSLDIPEEIWEHIISKLHHDRHLQPLSLVCKCFLSITNRHKQTLKIFDPTAHFLPSLLRRFPNLKHLSLSDFSGDPDPILLLIADSNVRLETLDLSNHACLPVGGLERLPVSILSGVRSLKISSLSAVSDDDLEMIANTFPNLEELDLSHPRGDGDLDDLGSDHGFRMATDHGISVLALKLKGLRKINLEGNHWVSDKGVVSLSENCPNLEEIVVKECSFVTQTGLGFALQACQKLNKIGLHGMDVVLDDIREPLSCALSLSVIDFSYMDVSDALLYAIVKANLPLKCFTLFHCKSFTYAGLLSFVKSYHSLDCFSLEGVYFLSDVSMCTLAKSLTKARNVKLNYCGKLSDSTFFTLIKLCPLLETVEMEHTKMGKEDFGVSNAVNSQIRTLNMSYNKNLTYESLEKIALACPNLEMLELASCPGISRKGVGEILRNCRRLKHLQINGCLGVKNLDLDKNTQKLELLVASGSGLNDEALIDIAKKCPDLVVLNLMNCLGLTSEGVRVVVQKCTKLKEINLNHCRNMRRDILPWMVFSRLSLRKIIPPHDHVLTQEEVNLYLKHGCYVNVEY